MVRLAIVGLGGYGWNLWEVIREVADAAGCQVVAAADARWDAIPERARELTDAGVERFDDALVLFDALRGRCDGVYIATGIHTHRPLAVAAMEAGFHVHVEKPPAASVQDVDAIIRAAADHERCCLVGFQAVHSRDMQTIEDRIVSGRLGRVTALTCRAGWPRDRAYYERNDWAGRLRRGDAWVLDGPAANALAHQITNMLFLASPERGAFATPTRVRAELYAAGAVESHDTAAIEFETAEGPTARFLASHCTESNFGPTIDIQAEKGSVTWGMWDRLIIRYDDGEEESLESLSERGRYDMVRNFVDAVRAEDPSLLRCSIAASRAFVLALDGAHESSRRIHRIPGARLLEQGTPQQRTVVDGLDDLIANAAASRGLFSDQCDAPAWAVAAEPFDLAGYAQFPRQFEDK